MCEPTTIATAALITSAAGTIGSVATGVAGASAAGDAAEAQYQQQLAQAQAEQQRLILQQDYYDRLAIHRQTLYEQQVNYRSELESWQNANFDKLVASAQESARDEYAAVHEQLDQRYMQAMDTMNNAHREADLNAAFVGAAAAETGTVGNSIRLSQQEHYMKSSRVAEIEYANLKAGTRQAERTMKAIQANQQNIINQAYPQPLAPIPLPEPVPYVMSMVTMPSEPSMTPYMLQGLSSVFGGMASLGGLGVSAYQAGLLNTTPTVSTGLPAGFPVTPTTVTSYGYPMV